MIPHDARAIAPLARRLAATAVMCAALALAVACTSDDEPPPRSPLGPAPTGTPVASTATPVAAPAGTASPAPTAEAPAPPPEGAPSPEVLEALVGNAIELMAEWLGVSATEFAIVESESLVWPDGCMGASPPGAMCTMALVPGFRLVLRDGLGGLHRVHGDAEGRVVRWVGERILTGTIVGATGDSLTVATDEGEVTAIAARGSRYWATGLPPGVGDLTEVASAVGDGRVAVAVDPSPAGDETWVIAWLVALE